MKRIAASMIGGLFTSFLMELLVYAAIDYRWKARNHQGDFDERPSVPAEKTYPMTATIVSRDPARTRSTSTTKKFLARWAQ
jgi:hypothetical protein